MQAFPEQLGAYYLWLKDRGIRYPVKAKPRSVAPRKPLQVAFVSDQPLTPAERDLLHKMIAAMQLSGEHAIVEGLAELPAFADRHEVQLMIPLGRAAADACPGDTVPTLHPRDLLARPDDKRIAWNDLKRAMARLKP